MYKTVPTENALLLNNALNTVGIETIVEHWDGHKHVDVFIPKGQIYIEIDGPHHLTRASQIMADFQRDFYSMNDGFHTIHIPNEIVQKDAMKIARAIKKVLNF
jgi:very-short-patch-repair endonuclease